MLCLLLRRSWWKAKNLGIQFFFCFFLSYILTPLVFNTKLSNVAQAVKSTQNLVNSADLLTKLTTVNVSLLPPFNNGNYFIKHWFLSRSSFLMGLFTLNWVEVFFLSQHKIHAQTS